VIAIAARRPWRVPLIVAGYTIAFFGVLPALLWALGGRLDAVLELPVAASRIVRTTGLLAICAGSAWMLVGMGALRWPGRGWPISHLPPEVLVGRGPYTLSRHPIYVGYTLAFAGAGLAHGSLGRGALTPILLTAGWMIYAVGFEEPRLVARFGDAYAAYAGTTPLVPFTGPLLRASDAAWRLSLPIVTRLANRTVLFRAGRSVWVTYGALVALGAGVAATIHAALLAGLGLSTRTIGAYHLALGGTMLLGGRLVWIGYEWRAVVRDPSIVWRRVGFVSFGGYLGFLVASAAVARLVGVPAAVFFDRAVPVAFVISAFGRLGCLSYGCCYGRPCAHGLTWSTPAAKVNRERGDAGPVPRVPTPLLSSIYALAAAGAGAVVLARGAAPGSATAIATLVYGLCRFGVEIYRDEPRFTRFALTRGQVVSACLVAAAITLLFAAGGTPAAVAFDASALATTLPAALAVATVAFLVCGYHRSEVGRW
jgi:phosphatidylglycerol:prolipoprotein diacylglycerol transferase